MGKVAVQIKVMPTSPEIDLAKIEEEAKKLINVSDSKIEPIGFGLNCLKLIVIVDDSEGTEKIENAIKGIEGVNEIEVESVTLI
jgi:elongation factor 1-beta